MFRGVTFLLMSDSQRYIKNPGLINFELDIHVFVFELFLVFFRDKEEIIKIKHIIFNLIDQIELLRVSL